MTNFLRIVMGLCALSMTVLSWADQSATGRSSQLSDIPYRPVSRPIGSPSPVLEVPRLTLEPTPIKQSAPPAQAALSTVTKPPLTQVTKTVTAPPSTLAIPLPRALSLPLFSDQKLEPFTFEYQTQGLILPTKDGTVGVLLPNKPNASWLTTPQRQTQASLRRIVTRLGNLDQSNADAQSITTPNETPSIQKAGVTVVTPLVNSLTSSR